MYGNAAEYTDTAGTGADAGRPQVFSGSWATTLAQTAQWNATAAGIFRSSTTATAQVGFRVAAVPEPATLALAGVGIGALAVADTDPEVASIGLTEAAAKAKNLKFKVGKFPYQASGKALAVAEPEGFVKILYGEPHGEIIGAHIIGSEATELIAELGLAMTLEATKDEIEATIHAHPTLAEKIGRAHV